MVRITNLTIDNWGDLVSHESSPQLSWQLRGEGKILQEAYEIERSSTRNFTADVISSGVLPTESLINNPWIGASLRSREVAYLRVRSRVNGEFTAWSETLTLEAPLWANREWEARFITLPNDPGGDASSPTPIVRKVFKVEAPIKKARIYATAKGVFEIFLNGQKISDELFNPGWTSYRNRLAYRSFDVTKYLAVGENVVTAYVGDGWYRGNLTWENIRGVYGSDIGFLAQLEFEDSQSQLTKIVTDISWKVSTGEILAADFYNGCIIDLNKTHENINSPQFDDSHWDSALIVNDATTTLFPMHVEPVRETQRITPISQEQKSDGSILVDFGQNFAGYVEIAVAGNAGDEVVITHAEILKNGELNRALLRGAKAEDKYILAGSDLTTLKPIFTFHGFRYAQIITPAKIHSIKGIVINSDMPFIGNFESSNQLVNKLISNISYSQRANFIAVPTDCPQRDERLGWTGDAQVFATAASTLFNTKNFLSSWLKDLALEQLVDGAVANFVPMVELPPIPFIKPSEWYGGRAGWGDAATIVPWALYEAYGDVKILEDQFSSMKSWVNYLESKSTSDFLIPEGEFQFGDWLDPDAPASTPWAAKTNALYVSNAFYAYSSLLFSRSAKILGREKDAQRYYELYCNIKNAIYLRWGSEILTTPTGCAVALELEIAPAGDREKIASTLANLVRKNEGKIATGFLGTPLVLPALSKNGQTEAAFQLLLNEEMPGWLYQIKVGGTTMWERWDGLRPDGSLADVELGGSGDTMISFNHYAYGAVAAWIFRNVAGISPDINEPGYRKINFAPRPHSAFDWAGASIDTPYGKASIHWERVGNEIQAKFEVPAGVHAIFTTPSGSTSEYFSGSHSITWNESQESRE